jgi:hypothetical protein
MAVRHGYNDDDDDDTMRMMPDDLEKYNNP